MNNKNDRNSTNRYMTNGPRKSFGPNGCQSTTNNKDTKCGETKTLQIIQEFKKLYENKMKEIDAEAGGDCVQAKINLQQDWIRDLTEQNEMLVSAVEELEVEAADRVNMLEEKLKKNSKCACEVMECYRDFSINLLEDLQKMERTQNDLNNLIELIRRARNDGVWSTDGLQFYNLDVNELLGHRQIPNDETALDLRKTDVTDYKLQKALKEKENKIKELEERLQAGHEAESSKQLEELKKSMLDMRDALTAEVAHKHDTIVSLRRDVHVLEEQCRKADQQTHFKDDIIKELRKEIKQIKTQDYEDEIAALKRKIMELEEANKTMKDAILNANQQLNDLENKAEKYLGERDDIKRQHSESLSIIETLEKENLRSKSRLETLKEDASSSLSDLQCDMIKELECCERKNRESIDKIDMLRTELEKTKIEHEKSIEKITTLNDANQTQTEMISSLNAALEKKIEKPKTKSVCIGSSDGAECTKNAAVNVPSSSVMKNVAVENKPKMQNASTMLQSVENQIVQKRAPAVLKQEPRCASPVVTRTPDSPRRELFPNEPTPKRTNESPKMLAPVVGERPMHLPHDEPKFHVLTTTSDLIIGTGNVCRVMTGVEHVIEMTESQCLDVVSGELPYFLPAYATELVGTASEKEIQRLVHVDILNNATKDIYKGENLLPGTDLDLALYTDLTENKQELYDNDDVIPCFPRHREVPKFTTNQTPDKSFYKTAHSLPKDSTLYHTGANWENMSSESSDTKLNERTVLEKSMRRSAAAPQVANLPRDSHDEGSDIDVHNTAFIHYDDHPRYEESHRTKKPKHSGKDSNATNDLQHVVHDLNESVSRIMKKSTDDKSSRKKIAKLEEQLHAIHNKDEMINVQSDTLNIFQIELQALKQKEHEVEVERRKRGQEVENLKMTIRELEKALANSQERSQNLQKAVDLYMNSVNVLEESEERWRTEIAQQRITIVNLQEALVTTKHQLEESQRKELQEVSLGWAARWFGSADSKSLNDQYKNVHEV